MNLKDKTLGEIVANDYRTSAIFQKHNMDFCCGGKKNFSVACKEAKVNPIEIEGEILDLDKGTDSLNYFEKKPSQLIDIILSNHHKFIEEESESLLKLSKKVYEVHGASHPELKEIDNTLHLIFDDMLIHQRKEEQILFPYIEAMQNHKENNTPLPRTCFGDVNNPINAMESDHKDVGKLMFKLKKLSSNFIAPVDACASYETLYKRLENLANNTFQHIHIENNILFPKALEMRD